MAHTVRVELWQPVVPGGAPEWVDISDRVLHASGIRIQRGMRPGSQSRVSSPATATMTLINTDGRFEPSNPASPSHLLLGRNVPLRVVVTAGGVDHSRFHGEVAAWPVSGGPGGQAWSSRVTITAAGLLRRLAQRRDSGRSSLRRALEADPDVAGHWPLEDGPTSVAFPGAAWAATTPGVAPAVLVEGQTSTRQDGWTGSAPLPILDSGVIRAALPSPTGVPSAAWVMWSSPDVAEVARVMRVHTPGASAGIWEIQVDAAFLCRIVAYSASGAWVSESGWSELGLRRGGQARIGVEISHVGGSTECRVVPRNTGTTAPTFFIGHTAPGLATGIQAVEVGDPLAGAPRASAGHLVIWDGATSIFDAAMQQDGWAGESAVARFTRVCAEQGMAAAWGSDVTQLMGPQQPGSPVEILDEIGALGFHIFDARSALQLLCYGPTRSATMVDLTSLLGTVLDVRQADDDALTANDVRASREGGGEVHLTVDAGPMSTQDWPLGVGRYGSAVTVPVHTDLQLVDQASWRLAAGTTPQARLTSVQVDLTKVPAATATLVGIAPGARVRVPRPAHPGPALTGLVTSISEEIDAVSWRVTAETVPDDPHRWQPWDGSGARWDSADCVLSADAAAGATTLAVSAPTDPWALTAAPLALSVGGEPITATGIATRTSVATTPRPTAVAAPWLHQVGTGMTVARAVDTSAGPTGRAGWIRATVTTIASGGNTGHYWRADGLTSGAAGQQVVCSMWVRASAAATPTLSLTPRSGGTPLAATDPSGATVGGTPGGTVTLVPGLWQRLSWQITTPSTWDGMQVWAVHPATQLPLGATSDATSVMVEVAPVLGGDVEGTDPTQQLLTVTRASWARMWPAGTPVRLDAGPRWAW